MKDAATLTAQNAAFQAAQFESDMLDAFLAGRVSEWEYSNAMEATAMACQAAIAAGATVRDLPAH